MPHWMPACNWRARRVRHPQRRCVLPGQLLQSLFWLVLLQLSDLVCVQQPDLWRKERRTKAFWKYKGCLADSMKIDHPRKQSSKDLLAPPPDPHPSATSARRRRGPRSTGANSTRAHVCEGACALAITLHAWRHRQASTRRDMPSAWGRPDTQPRQNALRMAPQMAATHTSQLPRTRGAAVTTPRAQPSRI